MSGQPARRPLFARFMLFLAGASLSFSPAALAVDPDYEAVGRQQYVTGQFKDAAASLRLAIYKGSKRADTWLLLGESYQGCGEYGSARQTYEMIQKYFPKTPEADKALANAGSMMRGVTNKDVKPVAAPPAATGTQTAAPLRSAAGARKSLNERIFVVPPQFGHPPVSSSTINVVRSVVARLPKDVYKVLDQGNANIYVTPNLIDRWPESVNTRHPTIDRYLSEETGRTYGRDAYICERTSDHPGTPSLGGIMGDATIRNYTYTYLGHALNDCLELPSKDEQFIQMYKQDANLLDKTSSKELQVYLDEREGVIDTFAALAASIMGSDENASQHVAVWFPRSRAWIEKRIKMLSNR